MKGTIYKTLLRKELYASIKAYRDDLFKKLAKLGLYESV